MTYMPRASITLSPVGRWNPRPYPAAFTGSIGTKSTMVPFSITISTGPSGGMARLVPGVPRPEMIVAPRITRRLKRSPRVVPIPSGVAALFVAAIDSAPAWLQPRDGRNDSAIETSVRHARSGRRDMMAPGCLGPPSYRNSAIGVRVEFHRFLARCRQTVFPGAWSYIGTRSKPNEPQRARDAEGGRHGESPSLRLTS